MAPSLSGFGFPTILPRRRTERESASAGADGAAPPRALERDDFSSSHHPALRSRFARDLFRKPVPTFRDHALNPTGGLQRAGADETLEPPAVRMHLAPVLAGKIDHRQARGWQIFVEPLARLDVAAGDQQPGEVVQPGIV